MTSNEGKQVCLKGWQVAGIKNAVAKGMSGLPSLDPFNDIDPMLVHGFFRSDMTLIPPYDFKR